jgi:hypothetical protein
MPYSPIPSTMTLNEMTSGGFRQWVKTCVWVSMHLGFAAGFCTLVLSLAGGSAHANLFVIRLHGPVAGLVNLAWGPLLACLVSLPLSAIAYPLLRWTRRLLPMN